MTPDAYGIIRQHWPYDGPHSPDRVTEAAAALGELVRYLNNATRHRATLPSVGSTHQVINQLRWAVAALPQLVIQVRERVVQHAADPTLHDDRRDRLGSWTSSELMGQLSIVHSAVLALGGELAAAASLSCHLGEEAEAPTAAGDVP